MNLEIQTIPEIPEDDPVLEVFRSAGHRVTGQRLTLLGILRAQRRFLDAEAIFHLAQALESNLSLATVYRTLSLFKEMGLIEGRIVGSEQDREEYSYRGPDAQYLLTCKRCGKVIAVGSDIVDEFRAEVATNLGITVLGAHSCFVGYCADCTEALAAEEAAEETTPGVSGSAPQ